jgi:hypothetical protein
MQSRIQRIDGTVTRARVAPGSKSDRTAVVLRTARGDQYILRRAEGNAFHDEALEALVGAEIAGTGIVAGQTFIMNDWTVKNQA